MIDAQPPAEGARRAALALHALGETDRKWLLARLESSQREHLKGLLGELRSLGIRPDVHVVRRVLAEQAGGASGTDAQEQAKRLRYVLENETPAVRELMLSSIPAELAAAVCEGWSLHEELQPQHRPDAIESAAAREAILAAWKKLAGVAA